MSCWVAPRLAAEFWGLPVADILALVSSGRLMGRTEGGFSFVRLPGFAALGQCLAPAQRPPTFNPIEILHSMLNPSEDAVTPEERAALLGGADTESEMGPPPDEDPDDDRISNWREGRKRASATRRGPGQRTI